MPLPDIEWSTTYPTSQDTDPVASSGQQDDLTNESAPAADDGNNARVSHPHALRDKLQSVAKFVGDTSILPLTSLRARAKTSLRPHLSYFNVSRVDVAAAPGQPALVRRVFQDDKARSFNGTLSFDPSTGATDGGLDTGTEASSTWYYLYLVPSTGNDDLIDVRGSTNVPATGPTGYSEYEYVGAVRNNSGSDIDNFAQSNSSFFRTRRFFPATIAAVTKTAIAAHPGGSDPGHLYDISDGIPDSASAAMLDVRIERDGAGGTDEIQMDLFVDGDVDTVTTSPTTSTHSFRRVVAGQNAFANDTSTAIVPTPNTPKSIGIRVFRVPGGTTVPSLWAVLVTGWEDGSLKA